MRSGIGLLGLVLVLSGAGALEQLQDTANGTRVLMLGGSPISKNAYHEGLKFAQELEKKFGREEPENQIRMDPSRRQSVLPGREVKMFGPAMRWVNNFGVSSGGWDYTKHLRYVADVNGDGLQDVVAFGESGVFVSLSAGSTFGASRRWISDYGYSSGWRTDQHPRLVIDMNSDGRADIVGFGSAGVFVSLSTGFSFAPAQRWVSAYGSSPGAGGWNAYLHPRFVADVNGDGFNDVIGFGHSKVFVSISTGSTLRSPRVQSVNNFVYTEGWEVPWHPRFMADVNGDGKSDIVGCFEFSVDVSLSQGNSYAAATQWRLGYFGFQNTRGWVTIKHPRMLADVNGDGKADMVGFGSFGVSVSISTGTEFGEPLMWSDFYAYDAGNWRVERDQRFMADVNGDGRDDVVGIRNDGVWVSLSTGSFFSSPKLWLEHFGSNTGSGSWEVSDNPRVMADVNGDGKADIVGFGDHGVDVALTII